MTDQRVSYSLSPELEKILGHNQIQVDNYKPAYESTGLDLYYTGSDIAMYPGETKLLSTGLFVHLPTNIDLRIRERGSVTKTPLMLRAGHIEAGYSGEVFVACYYLPTADVLGAMCNPKDMWPLSKNIYHINYGQKLPFQGVLTYSYPWTNARVVTLDQHQELHKDSLRGVRAIGSTN